MGRHTAELTKKHGGIMNTLRRMALVSTIATYILIFIGGLVRVSGAGLGCPDWPKCFGRWIPPTDVSQLPAGIDPSLFNITLAWIEYLNRLSGMLVGILIAITAVLALMHARRVPRIFWPAVAAGLLTALQGWQGSVVISSELEPMVVSVHAVLALIIVSLLVWITQQAYYQLQPRDRQTSALPAGTGRWITILWIISIVQIILGTRMREGLEVVSQQFPLLSSAQWVTKIGAVSHIHMTLGLAVAVITWWFGRRVIKRAARSDRLVRQTILAAMVLAGAQIVSGLAFMFIGIPPLVQIFHLWMASLFIGALLIVFAAARSDRRTPAVKETT